MSFDGLHIVVTGGTGALGATVVDRLTNVGAVCHIPSRGEKDAANHRVKIHAGIDLTIEEDVQAFYAGLPDIYASVHTAGGFAMAPRKSMLGSASPCAESLNIANSTTWSTWRKSL